MPHAVLLKQLTTGSLLSPLKPLALKPDPPQEVLSVSRRLGERNRQIEEDLARISQMG